MSSEKKPRFFLLSLHSFLAQLIARMLVIILLLTGVFSLLAVCLEGANTQRQLDASHLNMLNGAANAMDLTLENLCQQMRQVAVNAHCVNAMVVPGGGDYDRTQNILTLLGNTVSGSQLVSAALLYTPTDGMLYTSNGAFLPAEEFVQAQWIERYEGGQGRQATYCSDGYDTQLHLDESGMILYQNFFPQPFKQIGVVIFRIDQAYFISKFLVDAGSAERSSVHIYAQDGTPLLYGQSDLLLPEGVLRQIREDGRSAGYAHYLAGAGTPMDAYFYKSPSTGWIYCYKAPGSVMRTALALSSSFPWLLPLISVAALLGVIYMARKCYSPIRRLAEAASTALGRPDGAELAPQGDEVELIGRAFSVSREKNAQLSQVLQSVRDDVLERLFSGIIDGKDTSDGRITEILESLEEPFGLRSPLVVLGIAMEKEQEEEVAEPEMIRLLLVLREHLSGQVFSCCVMRGQGSSLVVPAFFADATDADTIRMALHKLARSLPVLLRASGCTVYLAYSAIYHNINDLSYAYLEMQDALKQKLFYGKDPQQTLTFPDISNDISARIQQILHSVDEGNVDKAIEILCRVVPAVADGGVNGLDAARELDLFSRALLDKLMVGHQVNGDSLVTERAKLQRILCENRDNASMVQRVQSSLIGVLRELQQRNKTKKYQNILRATEYIEANYFDCDLSLDRTAVYVGITASYLSRLFREELGVAFVDYLRDVRIDKCKRFLTTTDLPITSIGYQAGFSSMQSFFRTFKRALGVSPGTYRQQNKQ